MDSGLFMTDQDVLDFFLGIQCVVNVQHSAARIAKHTIDAFFLKAADENFSASDQFQGMDSS
jgi:hypothetical protein